MANSAGLVSGGMAWPLPRKCPATFLAGPLNTTRPSLRTIRSSNIRKIELRGCEGGAQGGVSLECYNGCRRTIIGINFVLNSVSKPCCIKAGPTAPCCNCVAFDRHFRETGCRRRKARPDWNTSMVYYVGHTVWHMFGRKYCVPLSQCKHPGLKCVWVCV